MCLFIGICFFCLSVLYVASLRQWVGQLRSEVKHSREYVNNADELPRRHCGWFRLNKRSKFSVYNLRNLRPEIPICVIYILPNIRRYFPARL